MLTKSYEANPVNLMFVEFEHQGKAAALSTDLPTFCVNT